MRLQKNNYAQYVLTLGPWLLLAALGEIWLCSHFFEAKLVTELAYFLLLGLLLMVLSFWSYAKISTVTIKPNSIQIKNPLLSSERELLLSDIHRVDIQRKASYGHATLHLRSGERLKVSHLDAPEVIQEAIKQRHT